MSVYRLLSEAILFIVRCSQTEDVNVPYGVGCAVLEKEIEPEIIRVYERYRDAEGV